MSSPPSAYDRHSRRYSSGSSSLIRPALNALRNNDPDRPYTASRMLGKPTGGSAVVSEIDAGRTPRSQTSVPSKRFSTTSSRKSEDGLGDAVLGNTNRWSSSTASSVSTAHHRRHSSFSKRFSLGASALNPGFRSLSPPKRRRPSDAPATLANSPPTSPATLPSVQRFSPLTLPNVSYNSPDLATSSTSAKPTSSHPALESSALPNKAMENATRTASPQKRLRDPVQRNASNLADIQEADRAASQGTTTTPALGASQGTFLQDPTSSQTAARQTSPTRRPRADTQNTQDSNNSAGQGASTPGRRRSRRDKDSRRSMLTKALKRANEAVHLDNEQDYDAAVVAYEEACQLLDSVLFHATSEEDKQRLTAIRGTYMSRVAELQRILHPYGDGASFDADDAADFIRASLDGATDDVLSPILENATAKAMPSQSRAQNVDQAHTVSGHTLNRPARGGSNPLDSTMLESSMAQRVQTDGGSKLPGPKAASREEEYKPNPLALKRGQSPVYDAHTSARNGPASGNRLQQRESGVHATRLRNAGNTESWYHDGGDEIPDVPSSPNHSVSSRDGVRRKDLRTQAQDTEAEFDAALDAAIESAYNDGYEPFDGADFLDDDYTQLGRPQSTTTKDPISDQAYSYAQRQSKIQRLSQRKISQYRAQMDLKLDDDHSDAGSGLDSDEEDQLLEGGAEPEASRPSQPATNVPRQSDSSGYSARTFGSSAASSLNTAGTSLGTVDENLTMPSISEKVPEMRAESPAKPAAPTITTKDLSPISTNLPLPSFGGDLSATRSPRLQDRRTSSKAQKLVIETSPARSDGSPARQQESSSEALQENIAQDGKRVPKTTLSLSPDAPNSGQGRSNFRLEANAFASPYPSPFMGNFGGALTPPMPALSRTMSAETTEASPPPASPGRAPSRTERPYFKQNFSSLSINQIAQMGTGVDDPSPGTPMSFAFPSSISPLERQGPFLGGSKTPPDGSMKTPAVMTTKMKIFDNEIHSVALPGASSSSGPKALEPCPESTLLRPFWMMRCFYQTLTHPKGGYISNKLFVPHDVWKVKNVKLKGIEDKVANCDLLTAALLKLSTVDDQDADAMLEGMQSFESVLEQAQSNLSKKLGNEVGVQGVSLLFKDAPSGAAGVGGDSGNQSIPEEGGKTTSTGGKTSSKGYLNSWRKLRSKSSSAGLTSSHGAAREGSKDGLTMSSVPMTSSIVRSNRALKREHSGVSALRSISIDGPNSNYAGALAKLCDAVQVLDSIARQVEDPGLRHSSPTHVGLELSMRHAAEFFGFFVCRFILQDMMLLTEKFVKRASEWVLS